GNGKQGVEGSPGHRSSSILTVSAPRALSPATRAAVSPLLPVSQQGKVALAVSFPAPGGGSPAKDATRLAMASPESTQCTGRGAAASSSPRSRGKWVQASTRASVWGLAKRGAMISAKTLGSG